MSVVLRETRAGLLPGGLRVRPRAPYLPAGGLSGLGRRPPPADPAEAAQQSFLARCRRSRREGTRPIDGVRERARCGHSDLSKTAASTPTCSRKQSHCVRSLMFWSWPSASLIMSDERFRPRVVGYSRARALARTGSRRRALRCYCLTSEGAQHDSNSCRRGGS